jgi:pterin-4a-carbinolamine dehydratase
MEALSIAPHSRLRLRKLVGRYLLMEIFLYIDIEDLYEKLHSLSILGRQYLKEMFTSLQRRADEECEERDLKKGRVQVDLGKAADWAYMLMNYSRYKRPMNYEVTAHSFEDAVAFMSKVAQKEDHKRLIRVTALKLELDASGWEAAEVTKARF